MAEDHSTELKQCSCCLETKSKQDFFKASCCKDGLRGECKACVSAKHKIYSAANASKISEQKKSRYYADGADVVRRERSASYYSKNRERIKEASRRWHADNASYVSERRKTVREKLNAQANRWRSLNRHKARATTNAWYARNKDRLKPGRKAAKASRRSAGKVSNKSVEFLMDVQRGRCACCKMIIRDKRHHLDHIVALASGGDNSIGNLQLLCPPCNLSKGSKNPVDFMQSRGFLL